jgi:hypothetical protein
MGAFFYLIFNDGIFIYIIQSYDKSAIKVSFIKIFIQMLFLNYIFHVIFLSFIIKVFNKEIWQQKKQ